MQKNKVNRVFYPSRGHEKEFPLPFLEQLSAKNKAIFIEYEWVKNIPSSFEDSTHQLWVCKLAFEQHFLKLCLSRNESVFWQAVHSLFGFELASSLGQYEKVYQTVSACSPLVIPKLWHSASCTKEGGRKFSGFLLTEYLEGQVLTSEQLTLKQVAQIAEHVALLHQQTSQYFGALFEREKILPLKGALKRVPPPMKPEYVNQNVVAWKQNLKQTLSLLNKHQSIPVDVIEKTVGLVDGLQISHFQPIMLDLRWDQFLQIGGEENLALLDLDAMVWAPRELELVMLEYLLTPAQAEVFTTVYTQYHEMPDLKRERSVYRVLLFQMNVLGESNFNRWMAHPVCF